MADAIYAALAAAAAAAEKQGHEVLVIARERGGDSAMLFGEPRLLTVKRPFGELHDVRLVDGKPYSVTGRTALTSSSAALAASMRAAPAPPCHDAEAFQKLTDRLLFPTCGFEEVNAV